MFLKEEYTRWGDLIFEDDDHRIFYNHEREFVTTQDFRKSTHPQAIGRDICGTSFGSTNEYIFFSDGDLKIGVCRCWHESVIKEMIKRLGIKDFSIENKTKEILITNIKGAEINYKQIIFKSPGDYSYFKLKYFDRFENEK
jgi:hypothetical protein